MLIPVIVVLFIIGYFRSKQLFWVLVWPGTVVHELLHFVVGLVLLAKPCTFSVLPKPPTENGQVLGGVEFLNITWWNAFPISIAPMLGIPIAIIAMSELPFTPTITGFIGAWVIASILEMAWPSDVDFESAFKDKQGLVFWASVTGLAGGLFQ